MATTVRKATEADIDFLAESILVVSRNEKKIGLFDLIFNTTDDIKVLDGIKKLLTTTTKSYVHLSNFLVLSSGDKNIGSICGYEARLSNDEILARALFEIGIDETYHERIAVYFICASDTNNQTYVLDFLYATTEHDTLESYKSLVGKAVLNAKLRGYHKIQLSLDVGSSAQELIYKKLGFEIIDNKKSEYYEEVFGHSGIERLQMSI